MSTELKMTLLLRRAEFADSCVLQLGEPGYHTSTKEFKVGDGSTIWKELPVANETQIKSWITALKTELEGKIATDFSNYYTKEEIDDLLDALRQAIGKVASDLSAEVTARQEADADLQEAIDTKLATETFNGHVNGDHAGTATEITAEIGEAEGRVNAKIGASTDAKEAATVYGAIKAEAYAREQADTTITNKIGDIGTGTVASRLEAADQAAADAAGAASAAGQAIDNHKADKDNPHEVTKTQVGLGNVDNKSVAEIKTEFTGAIAEGNTGFVTGGAVYAADKALDEKISGLETRIGNVTNVMNFRGAVENFTDVESPVEGDVITFSAELKDGDAIVAKAGSEWVYSGNTWVEIGTASASDAAIADLQSRMDAAEEDIGENASAITALGTNKLNTSDFDTWKQGHEADHAKKQAEISADIATAKGEAITEAGRLDGELEAKLIGGDTDTAHAKTIKGAKDYAKAYADSLATNYDAAGAAATAEQNAKNYADSQDNALKTAIEGAADDTSSKATIAGAKKYAASAAAEAEKAAKDYADGLAGNYDAAGAAADAKAEVIGEPGDAKTANTIYGAKAFATDAANTAEQNAIAAVVGTADSDADSDTIKGVKKAYVAADTTVLNSAKAYADGKVTDAHKNYQTATVKDAAHDSATNPSFITSISIDKGHVTGATVRNLAEVLAAMEFIFDGGTSAN